MKNAASEKIIRSSADPQRALHFFNLISETSAAAVLEKSADEQLKLLAALFSGSPVSANTLVAHPDWLGSLEIERLRFPRREQGFHNEINEWLVRDLREKNYSAALAKLREFKTREMIRIAARDLARFGNVSEITREISDVAGVCLESVWQICRQQFIERFGQPFHQDADGDWTPTEFCVLGMGKLGGQELNYSSDVDVLFVYMDEGQVFKEPPRKGKTPRAVLANHQFFNRLAESFIAEVSRVTEQGNLFRIDLRLRPEGDTGPLSRSLESYENYYAQWGQTWERMMLIKARRVAGSAALAGEFLETIQSFRYPRAIDQSVLHEIGAMKDRIESEVVRSGELERNVKLGRGGIREIEFIAQSQQLIHAGRIPFLQGAQTLPALEKLAHYDLISGNEARALRDAYCFLRDVEHRLQMEENRQTHTIPEHRETRERLARLMGFADAREFEKARRMHTQNVRVIFDRLFKSEPSVSPGDVFPREFVGEEAEWKKILAEHSFRDADKAFHVLREFVEGPGYIHVSPRTTALAHRLLAKFFALCRKRRTGIAPVSNQLPAQAERKEEDRRDANSALSDPDRVLTRLDTFITAYGARNALFELWNSNPAIFELLIQLFDRSEFLAEMAIRSPELVDEFVTSGRLRQSKTAAETLADLRHGLKDKDQFAWLRRYHQAELMRIGLRDILGLADCEKYLAELSALADACVQYALEVAMKTHRLKSPPFVIIGLGKFGGAEIDYGSDLDIIFVTGGNPKNLRKLQQLARELMELISARTELGIVFHTDARLRPDGEKGLLVNTLSAFEVYYRRRAQLWEIQSLTRTRPVAGDFQLGEKFQKLAAELTEFRSAGFPPDWKKQIHNMRLRIERERTPPGKDDLAIKTGKGGLMDAEFIAQTLCLENGWQIANTLRALERGRETRALPDAEKLIANYRELRRVERILRRWSYEGETVLPEDPAPFYRVSVRCGFESPEKFREAIAKWRKEIRTVYEKVFNAKAQKSRDAMDFSSR